MMIYSDYYYPFLFYLLFLLPHFKYGQAQYPQQFNI